MTLLAISDLHLRYEANRKALARMPPHRDAGLILAGDLGETEEDLRFAFDTLRPKFRKLFWVPGNHELWTISETGLRGEAKYRRLVEVCRAYEVLTPEDDYVLWPVPGSSGDPGHESRHWVVPTFLLYDYTFGPPHLTAAGAVRWAAETGIVCADEALLHPDPFPSREAWCQARCQWTEQRLARLDPRHPIVLVNHFPLRSEHAVTPLIPRFSIWCGTRRTEDWHRRFPVRVVVSGHLHIRSTRWRDGVRFEEVSLGYPQHRDPRVPIESYLCEVLPGPPG